MALSPTTSRGSGTSTPGWTQVVAASDQSIASSTVLTNDAELAFQTVAGVQYSVFIVLRYGSPAGAGTPDIQTAFGEDATPRGFFTAAGLSNSEAQFTALSAADQTDTSVFGTAATDRTVLIAGSYIGNGGIFRLLWSQFVSGANATIRRAGSAILYRPMV